MKNSWRAEQNNLLFKFLIIATIVFIILVAILFWQQREVEIKPVTDEKMIVHFSDRGERSSLVETYLYGAKYIHDIEAYSEINDLFFYDSFPQLNDKDKIIEAVAEVKAENARQDEFGKSHVYSTSYYIGNLLISPNLTLHAVLADESKPNTSILLDSALSDTRSGVVKIQNFYDVAPPAYYEDAYVGATYFSTASFPSLTVTEAGIVLYLLAELDPENARLYEQFLHQYANQVLASGANFYLDIEYALKLASVYFSIIKENPDYKSLLEVAKREWLDNEKISAEKYFERKFAVSNFPYESFFNISKPKVNSYGTIKGNAQLSGVLMLSLIDNRLPDPVGKLYSYDLVDDSLLPFAVDLQERKFPALKDVVTSFAGTDQDKYFFVSGDKPRTSESRNIFLDKSQIFYRQGENLTALTDSGEKTFTKIQKNLELSPGQDRLLFNQFLLEQEANPDSWEIRLDKLIQGKLLKTEVIARGSSPVLMEDGESVLFWRENSVWQINNNSGLEQKIIELAESNTTSEVVNLDYLEETKTLVISRSQIELDTLQPSTLLLIYKLGNSTDIKLDIKKVYDVEIRDASVLSLKQLPGGNHLAILVNETSGGDKARLLILEINNGIIIKQLNLEPYANKAMEINSWMASE